MESAIFAYRTADEKFGKIIAIVDNSYGCCEVDISEIWTDGNKFFLLTASGCSCWSGEYESREFNSLDELYEKTLDKESDSYRYNPSLEGLKMLIEQAKVAMV